MNTKKFPRSRCLSAAVSAVLSFAAASLQASPQNGAVTAGTATINTPNANDTVINQTTSSVSINWDSFELDGNDSVTFNQPSASSVALNRILDSNPSTILGSIDANGRIFLMNPNGIIFGSTATVNVGSLVATSLSTLSESGGVYTFTTPEAAGIQPAAVTNAGTLTADSGGAIALLGGSVLNNGTIIANLGTVALGVGRAATVSFDSGGLFNFQITSALDADSTGEALVRNSGILEAAGGQVVLTARQAATVLEQAVNNSGVIRASRATAGPGGTIRLIGDGGAIGNTGDLDVSAVNGAGGSVQIDGSAVDLGNGTTVAVGGSTTDGTLQITTDGAFGFQNALAVDGNLSVTAGGNITQTAAIDIDGASSFTTVGGSSILLGSANSLDGAVTFTSSGGGNLNNITIRDTTALTFDPLTIGGNLTATAAGITTEAVSVGGNLDFTSTGGISQNAALQVTGTTAISAAGQTVDLDNTGNEFNGSIGIVAGATSLTNFRATQLRASTITGSLDLTSFGSITQSDQLSVTGATTINAPGQAVTLNNAGNSFAGGIGFISAATRLTNSGSTNLLASDISGTFDVTSVGTVTQSDAVSVDGITTIAASGQSVTLTDTNNAFSGGIGIAGDVVALTNDVATDLGASTVTGTLNVTSTGAITQTGILNVTGATTLNAAGQDITLGSANVFAGGVGATGEDVSLTNSVATNLRATTAIGALSVNSTGALTQSGVVDAGSATLSSSTGVTLNNNVATGTLAITAGTSIDQTGGVIDASGAATFTAGNGGSISANRAGNDFGGTVTFAAAGIGTLQNVSISDDSSLALQALTLTGNLDVTADGISQSGALLVGGSTTLDSDGTIALNTLNTASLTANAVGAITQSGALTVTGAASLTASGQDITLQNAGNTFIGSIDFTGEDVRLRNNAATALSASTASGVLDINSSGAITQSGVLDVTGTATFNAGAQNITLSQANEFRGGIGVTGANATIVNSVATGLGASTVSGTLDVTSSGALTQSGVVSAGSTTLTSNGAVALTGTLGTGSVTIAAGTDITQTSGSVTTTAAANFTAGDNRSITLDQSGNSFGNTVNFAATTGTLQDVLIADTTALDLQGLAIDGDLTASAASLTQSGALSVGGTATLSSAAGITLNATQADALTVNVTTGDVTQSSNLDIAGTTTINAGGRNVTLTNSGNFFGGDIVLTADTATLTNSTATTLAASTVGSTLTVTSTGAINQTGALNVTGNSVINAAGQTVTLNAANTFGGSIGITAANASLTNGGATTLGASTIGNDLTVFSTGAIAQSNAISVAGDSTFNAAGQDVTLTAGNMLSGGITLTAANASLTNAVATNLQSSTITNNLTVNSSGGLTQSGALDIGGTTTIVAAGQNVMLNDMANTFGGGVAVSGAHVTLVDADSIDLRASTVSGDLDVTAVAGTITQSGALNVTSSSTFTVADGQSILLADATNVFGGVRLASSGQLDNVSLAAASSLDLQGLDITGDLVVTTGGALTQSGTLIVAGDADFRTLNAGSNIALNGANQFGSVSATGAGDVAITQGTGNLNLRQATAADAARLEATSGSIVDDAADPSAASVSAASVELVALDNIGTVTDLLTRQGTAIAVNTNGGSLAAHVTSTNGQVNLALPGGSAPAAAAGAISAGGSGRLLIQSAGDLSLNAFNSAITGFDEIGFSADGTLNIPGAQSDLIAGPLATLYLRGGVDIARADRTFNLSASHLIFDSASQGGDVALNIDADRIDASVGGSASLTIQDASDLMLGTVNAGNNVTIRAANIRDDGDVGSVTRVSAGGTVSFDASAGIGEADGVGGGRIDTAANAVSVNSSAGSVYLSHAGDLQISGDTAAGAIDVVAPTGNVTVTSTLRANGPLSIVAGTVGSITANISLSGIAQSTGSATLTAANGGTISDANDAAAHLVAQSATLSAAGVGSQANALGVEVGALSAGVSGDLYVNVVNAVQLRTIDAATVSISATGAMDDDGDNTTRLTAQSVSLSGTSVGTAGVGGEIDTTTDSLSASASAGGIYVGESGDLQLAALSASGTGNSVVIRAEGAITDDGGVATRVSGGSLALTGTSIGAAGAAIDTQVTLLNATASTGGVFVNEVDDLQANTVTGTDVVLTVAGALTDDGNDSTRVTGTNIRLNAARIGTSDNRVDTTAGSLTAIATAGGIYAAEQDDVALGEIRASGTGNTVDIRTGGNGNMTVQTLVTQGGAVNLTAGGTGSITVTGAIESNNGVVNLTSGNALALPGLDTGTGSVVLRTVNDLNVGTINASSVSITSDTGNVSLGTINASGGTVTVSANNGAITDGDATSLTARDATLSARTIGGPDQALNLAVDNLTATASAGGIYVNDIGGLTLHAINATGAVSIVTTGALSQAAGIASGGDDIDIFAESILMQTGATTLSGNGNISYVANNGTVSLEVLDAGMGRALVIASDSVYTTLDPNSGISNLSGSAVEIRAGGLFGGAGEIGTLSNPITIATPNSTGRSVYLIVPAVNGIQTTTPSINYSGSSASLLLKGYTGTNGTLLFDLSSTFSPETILSGDETIVPLANGRVAVNSDSLSAAKQALSSGVITRVNVDWAAFDPNVSLFGTLDPSLRLPADQIDEEVPTANLIPDGTVLSVTRDGWELKREI